MQQWAKIGLLANSMASKIDRKRYNVNTYCNWFAPNAVIHVIRTIGVGSQKNDLYTHKVIAPSNKTPALRKSTNMGVWAVGTLNQLFIRGS